MNRKPLTFGIGFGLGVLVSAILIQFKVPQPIVYVVSAAVTFLIIAKGK